MECEDCKKRKLSSRFSGSLTKRYIIRHLNVETKGEIETESVQSHESFLTIVEKMSRHTTVVPIRTVGED